MAGHSDAESFGEFAREIILRMDRSLQEFAERQRAIFEDVRASREESRRYFEALDAKLDVQREQSRAELRDLHAESRAQTQALLRMIDRLDGGASA